jgi:hypothetical protein
MGQKIESLNDNLFSLAEQFRSLQNKLPDQCLELDDLGKQELDILIVPSISMSPRDTQKILGIHHWEERLLPYLALLKYPNVRLIYVTSQPLHPALVDYYLHILPEITLLDTDVRKRLILLSTYDSSLISLSSKVLERPRLIQQISDVVKPEKSLMICYVSTPLERELSIRLQVPLYALDPDLEHWGTKSGSQKIFSECDVPHPDGSQVVWNTRDLAIAGAEVWSRNPNTKRMIIKLNEGIGGLCTGILDLEKIVELKKSSQVEKAEEIYKQLDSVTFQDKSEDWASLSNRIQEQGAIIQVYIEGNEKRSPSVQGVITPGGETKIISTHEQILNGSDGLLFQGCAFPAEAAYRLKIQELGRKVGEKLAQKGVIGPFSVDFLAVGQPDENGNLTWHCQAVEINIRRGGASHPFTLLNFLTNGYYDTTTGLLHSAKGLPKYYITSEQIHEHSNYRGLLPDQLIEIISEHQLHFDPSTETGPVFHMMGALSEFGKLGITSIGNSHEEAKEHLDRVMKVLEAI